MAQYSSSVNILLEYGIVKTVAMAHMHITVQVHFVAFLAQGYRHKLTSSSGAVASLLPTLH